MYDLTPCYLLSFSDNGLITKVNQQLLQDLGYSRDELVGREKFEFLLTVGSRIFFQTHFYPLVKMQKEVSEIFLALRTKDGNQLPVLLNVAINVTNDKNEVHCGGLKISNRNRFEQEILEAKNVAEMALQENEELVVARKELQDNQHKLALQLRELSQKNRLQSQINKVLSHDLQEPLRKISFFSDRLLHESIDVLNEAGSQSLNRIISSIDKVRMLLDSLQRFNALDEKKIIYAKIDLHRVIDAAAERAGIAGNPEVQIEIGKIPAFRADEYLITAIFAELLDNSWKFRKHDIPLKINIKGVIVMKNIFVEMEDRYYYGEFIQISYTDNASGIAAPAENVFNIFRKANHNSTGVGMGLTIIQKMIEMHHGSIGIQSVEGDGSTFTIWLPVGESKDEPVV